nr:swi/snf and rsc complexes subunit ssr4 [Quercus suber]
MNILGTSSSRDFDLQAWVPTHASRYACDKSAILSSHNQRGRVAITMQNPSHGVAHTLVCTLTCLPPCNPVSDTTNASQINHVHLISTNRFAASAHLGLEGAYRYLLEAPQIVKQHSAMSWTYVSTPQDGSIWLEWLSPDRTNDRFPSDGYVWADQEQTFSHNYGGFQIEVMVHAVGYRPGYDSIATHARTRYHFVSKNPNHNAPPPDPQLWIVHYHPTDPQRHVPTAQIPPNPQTQQILRERAWLESQGRIEKKDFMLHDRDHWPTVNVPNVRQQPMPQPNPWPTTQQAQYQRFPNAYPQQPPAKRQRQQAPPVMPGPGEVINDTTIEDEENTTLGDYFDHLTPRDISMARYLQHHDWMEEVFSSPYASNQIVPADLGLGLMGELKGLTDGILKPPTMDFSEPSAKPSKPKEAQPFTNLKQDQLDEFNRRVSKHLEAGQAEIERMKMEHAAKMQEWKKSKTLMQAEKRLRNATWQGHEDAVRAHKLELPANGHRETEVGGETVEDVVKEMETILRIKITSHKDADLVETGGLEDEEERRQDDAVRNRFDAAKSQAQTLTNDASPTGMYAQGQLSSNQTQGQSQGVQAAAPPNAPQQANTQPANFAPAADTSADHLLTDDINDDSLMGGMDFDVNDHGVDFHDDTSHANVPHSQSVATASSAAGPSSNFAPAVPSADLGSLTGAGMNVQSNPAAPGSHQNNSFPDSANDNNIFGDSTFDDLTNMGEHGHEDDGLIDFDGGVGLEDSAFGDALHGMDDTEGPGGDAGT